MQRPRWTRYLATILLLIGVLTVGFVFSPHIPKTRHLDLQLQDASSITSLDLIWTRGDARPGDALLGSSWRFSAGKAPSHLHTTVQLPDGSYNVEITVARTTGTASMQRAIVLADADRIAVPVR